MPDFMRETSKVKDTLAARLLGLAGVGALVIGLASPLNPLAHTTTVAAQTRTLSAAEQAAGALQSGPAAFIPTGALFYAEADLHPSGNQGTALKHLGDVFAKQPGFSAAERAVLQTDTASMDKDLNSVTQGLDNLGHTAGIGVFLAGKITKANAANPPVSVLLVVPLGKGIGSIGDFFNTLKMLSSSVRPNGLYNGHILYSISGSGSQPMVGSMVDSDMVLAVADSSKAQDSLLRAALDAHDGHRASLAGSTQVQKLVASLPTKRLAMAYLDVPGLIKLGTASSNLPASEVQALNELVSSVGMALTALPDGMLLTMDMVSSAKVAAMSSPARPLSINVATQAPADSTFFLAMNGLGDSLRSSVKSLGPDTDAQFKAAFGADLTHDILPLLNGDMALSLGSRAASPWNINNPLESLRVRLAVALNNPAKTQKITATIAKMLQAQKAVAWKNDGNLHVDAQTGLSYAFSGSHMYAGLHLNDPLGPSLAHSVGYQAALTHVSAAKPSVIMFLNIDRLRGLIEHSLTASEMKQYSTEARPLMTALHDLTLSGGTAPDKTEIAQLFLGIH